MAMNSKEETERLVRAYLPLAKRLAWERTAGYVQQGHDPHDVLSDALLGLWQAAQRYDKDNEGGVPFHHYAKQRIAGQISDGRRNNEYSRTDMTKAKKLGKLYYKYAAEYGRFPSRDELAKLAGVSREQLDDLTIRWRTSRRQQMTQLDEPMENGELVADLVADPRPERDRLSAETRDLLVGYLGRLRPIEHLVVGFYYWQGMTQAEIGEVLQVTESRVSQVLTITRKKLGQMLRADQVDRELAA